MEELLNLDSVSEQVDEIRDNFFDDVLDSLSFPLRPLILSSCFLSFSLVVDHHADSVVDDERKKVLQHDLMNKYLLSDFLFLPLQMPVHPSIQSFFLAFLAHSILFCLHPLLLPFAAHYFLILDSFLPQHR